MTNVIEKLREYVGFSSDDTNDDYEDIEDLLWNGRYAESGYKSKKVSESFEDHSRWKNYEKKIYEVTDAGETAYFRLGREVNASESQDGQENAWTFDEVVPKEVTVIQYVTKEGR